MTEDRERDRDRLAEASAGGEARTDGAGQAEAGSGVGGGQAATPMRTSASSTGGLGSPFIPLVQTEDPFEMAGITPPVNQSEVAVGKKGGGENYPVMPKVGKLPEGEEAERFAKETSLEMAVRVSVELKRLKETIVGMGIPAERLVLCHTFNMTAGGMVERWWWEVKQGGSA